MAIPLEWRQDKSIACMVLDGPGEEEFTSIVRAGLKGDFYASLDLIRNKFLEKFNDLEACICVLDGEVLYALVGGGANLALVRAGKTVPLMKTLKATATFVTGHTKGGDMFELTTSSSSHKFSAHEPVEPMVLKAGFRAKAIALIDKLLALIPERRIIVHGGTEGSRAKKASLIGIFLLLILGVSVYFGVQRRADNVRRSEYEPKLAQAEHDLGEAKELAVISQARARELILRARSTAKELKTQGVEDERLNGLLSELSKYAGDIAGIYESSASLFFDLTIAASAFEGADLALSGGELRILDSKGRRLVGLEVEGKRTEVIAGPDYIPDALAAAAYEGRSFILSSDGIREVTEDTELVVKAEWEAQEVLVDAFAGNLYVLDKVENQIWRYQGVSGGFLEKDEWFGEGFTRDVSEAVAWAIDGSIWTISREGTFKVYSMGAPGSFSVTGNPESFGDIVDIYTSDQSKYVYLLDRARAVVSIIQKNGDYVGEYVAPELAGATRLVVDEASRSILFLADSKLYKLPATHLENENN